MIGWVVTFGISTMIMIAVYFSQRRLIAKQKDVIELQIHDLESLMITQIKCVKNKDNYINWSVKEGDKMLEIYSFPKGIVRMMRKLGIYYFIACSINGYEWMKSKGYSNKANCKRAMKTFAKKKWEIENDNK